MPTTCGFPNCKFRSRYRGQEDNRHFYRIPKRPTQLRQRWLNAIGRTEETVVSQLRICSAHFSDGEKKDGDIPVPDPMLDPPVFISLPPKELRGSNASSSIQRLAAKRSKLLMQHHHNRLPPAYRKRHSIRINRQSGVNNEQRNYFGDSLVDTEPSGVESIFQKSALQQHQDLADSAVNFPVSTSCSPGVPFFSTELPGGGFLTQQTPPHLRPFLNLFNMSKPSTTNPSGQRPLVALLDGRDCSIEMPLLKDVATVAFCDAQSTTEIHEKAALLYHSISLSKEDLMKFKALKVVVRIGSGVHNVDLAAASELGIAICNTPAECVEETADSTISLILNMYRKTYWIAKAVQSGRQTNNVEQLRELVAGCIRIRGSTLGLIGLGRVGTAVAIRAKAFGFKVIFYDPHLPNGIDRALGIERCETLVEALSRSDCISLHCPLLPDTRYMLNQESMQKMKFGAFLINTSAAELVMNSALLSALKTGQVKAAALDIYEKECVDDISSEIFAQMHNVICTPHCAWFSDESSKELRVSAAKEIRRALVGRIPQDLVNCMNKEGLLAAARNRSDSKPTIHPAAKQQHLNGVQQHNKPAFAPHLGATNTAPPPGIGLSASDPFAAFAAAGMPTDALTAFGSSSTEGNINPMSYQNFLMSLNPMLLNNTLIHHQQQSQQMHPSSMAAAIGTSNSSTPSIYDFGQQAHNNMLQSNMQNFRKDTSKARQIKKEEHLGSRSPTTSPMPKRSNQSASGIISSNGDQKEAETQLMMQQKEPSINGSPKPSMNDTTDQKKGESSCEVNAQPSPKAPINAVDEEGCQLQMEEEIEEGKA